LTDVREVFITGELAKMFDITPAYIIRIAKSLNLPDSDFRETHKGAYLYNRNAIEKIEAKLKRNK
jgi:hypothetical protein